jgi:hypothetical protein
MIHRSLVSRQEVDRPGRLGRGIAGRGPAVAPELSGAATRRPKKFDRNPGIPGFILPETKAARREDRPIDYL